VKVSRVFYVNLSSILYTANKKRRLWHKGDVIRSGIWMEICLVVVHQLASANWTAHARWKLALFCWYTPSHDRVIQYWTSCRDIGCGIGCYVWFVVRGIFCRYLILYQPSPTMWTSTVAGALAVDHENHEKHRKHCKSVMTDVFQGL